MIVLGVFIVVICLCYYCFTRADFVSPEQCYILITGCDTGFGHAAVRLLDDRGCHVIATCLTESGVNSLKQECSSRCLTLQMDVTKSEEIQRVYKRVLEYLPNNKGLWGLVNNAGTLGKFGQSDWLEKSDYEYVMKVNFFGLVDVTSHFLPLLKQSRGRIVNTSSIIAQFRLGGTNPYTASKCAVSGFSDSLR